MTVGWWVGAGGGGTCRCKQTFSSFSAVCVFCCAEAQARLCFWPVECVPACRQHGPAAAVTVSDFGGWPAPPPLAAWSPLDGLAAGGCPVNAPVQTRAHTNTHRVFTYTNRIHQSFSFCCLQQKIVLLLFLWKSCWREKKGSHLFKVIPTRDLEVKYQNSASLFALLFHNLFKFLFVFTCDSGRSRKWAYHSCWYTCQPWKLHHLHRDWDCSTITPRQRLFVVCADQLVKCLLRNDSFTSSSTCMRAERSLSSCCRSSIISLLSSSSFSSSIVSGEPIPSSFSSARLLFGDEPLNSWGDAMHTKIPIIYLELSTLSDFCVVLIDHNKLIMLTTGILYQT